MYSCIAQENTFNIYTQDAVFHDPIGIAKGKGSVRAQFVGLAKIFEKAEITKFRILDNPPEVLSTTILIDQDVAYYRKSSSSPFKVHPAPSLSIFHLTPDADRKLSLDHQDE